MITHSELLQRLFYDPDTGVFVWKVSHNKVKPGDIAGTSNKDGYIIICIKNKLYRANRLAWFYINGTWPINLVDHIDHNVKNNSIGNLRDVNKIGNGQNMIKAKKNNISGLLGVGWHKGAQKWMAQITVNYKNKYLGLFDDKEDAHNAYLKAKRELHSTCTI